MLSSVRVKRSALAQHEQSDMLPFEGNEVHSDASAIGLYYYKIAVASYFGYSASK